MFVLVTCWTVTLWEPHHRPPPGLFYLPKRRLCVHEALVLPSHSPGNNHTTSCFCEYNVRPVRGRLTSLSIMSSKVIHVVVFCPFYRCDDYYYFHFTENEVQETIWENLKSSLVGLMGLAGFYNSLEKSVLIHEPRPLWQLKSNFLCVVFPLGIFSLSFPFPTLPR